MSQSVKDKAWLKRLCTALFNLFGLTAGTPVTFDARGWLADSHAAVKASGAEVTTGTDDAKFATAKAIKDAGIVATPVKASGAEVTTGTDDAKFATAKALSDAGIVSGAGKMATDGSNAALPTSNPGAGKLWNDTGTVKVGT
jgi:hypothetical protein